MEPHYPTNLHPHQLEEFVDSYVKENEKTPWVISRFFNRRSGTLPVNLMVKYKEHFKIDPLRIPGNSYRILELYNSNIITGKQALEWGNRVSQYYEEFWSFPEIKKLLPKSFDNHKAYHIAKRLQFHGKKIKEEISKESDEFIQDLAFSALVAGRINEGLLLLDLKGLHPPSSFFRNCYESYVNNGDRGVYGSLYRELVKEVPKHS